MRQPPKLSEFQHYPVTGGIALLAIGITLLSWTKTDVSPLFPSALIRHGEPWRLITSIFPHAGVLHLLFNVYWLWVFGSLVEEEYGHIKTAALILLFAATSNAFEYAFAIGGIGLSGVGYGLFGMLWMLSRHDPRFHDAIDSRTVQLFVAWFFICIIGTMTGLMPIANIAHGVGAVIGILMGFAIALPERRLAAAGGIVILSLFGWWAATAGRPKVNLSAAAGYDEARQGYKALVANRNQDAVRWLREAVAYRRVESDYWYNLGVAYRRTGDLPAAESAIRIAAEGGNPTAQLLLGELYETGGSTLPKDVQQALSWYRKAAAQNDPDALNQLAWRHATSDDPAMRNPAAALELAQKAVELEKQEPDASHLDTLAEAYFVNQRLEEAISTEEKDIQVAEPGDKAEFQERLKKYQSALERGKQGKGAAQNRKSR